MESQVEQRLDNYSTESCPNNASHPELQPPSLIPEKPSSPTLMPLPLSNGETRKPLHNLKPVHINESQAEQMAQEISLVIEEINKKGKTTRPHIFTRFISEWVQGCPSIDPVLFNGPIPFLKERLDARLSSSYPKACKTQDAQKLLDQALSHSNGF